MPVSTDELNAIGLRVANGTDAEMGELYDHMVAVLNDSPDDHRARFMFAAVCNRAKHYGVAKAIMDHLLTTHGQWGALRINYGMALDYLGDQEASLRQYDVALRDKKVDHGNLNNNRASALIKLGRYEEADRAADKALALDPSFKEARINKAFARLAMGDLPVGWDNYEHALGTKHRIDIDYGVPRWRPGAGGARVIVHGEQGIGDEVMYASCIADLQSAVEAVAIDCDPKLAKLFRRSFPDATVVGSRNARERPWVADFKPTHSISIGSLPVYFRRRAEDFPRKRKYLTVDPDLCRMYSALINGECVIGLTWSGGGPDTKEKQREIPLAAFAPFIAANPKATFVSLQYRDSTADEIKASGLPIQHHHFATGKGASFDHVAAMVASCGRVVGTDTAVIHAAGALGVPTDCLLTTPCMWVHAPWHKAESPWYRTVKLHRMPPGYDWARYINHLVSQGVV